MSGARAKKRAAEVIIAIDPGPEVSGFVEYDAHSRGVIRSGSATPNEDLLAWVERESPHHAGRILVVEMIQPMGMPLGWSTILTAFWAGRYVQAWGGGEWSYLQRSAVKRAICGAGGQAKDSNIRQALIDRFGGDRAKAIGTKRAPGPLYGVSKHAWAALAVAVAFAEGARVAR